MLKQLADIYRQSQKKSDSAFNQYLARPLATPWVWLFMRMGLTPNQVTLMSLLPVLVAVLLWLLDPSCLSLWLGVVAVEFAYILDCADGQLARITQRQSPAGAALDFMMDEIKAFLVVGALGCRWAMGATPGIIPWLITVGTLIVLAVALALTRLQRTPEYAQAVGIEPVSHGTVSGRIRERKGPLWPLEMVVRCISQYPICLPVFALVDRMDLFVMAYGAVHVLQCGRSFLSVLFQVHRMRGPD